MPTTANLYLGATKIAGGSSPADFSNTPTGTYTDSEGQAWKYISFTQSGTLDITEEGVADFLVVGGGGGGGWMYPVGSTVSGEYSGGAGGGGGGGVLEVSSGFIPAGSHAVTVGRGGDCKVTTTETPDQNSHGDTGGGSCVHVYAAPGGGGGAQGRYEPGFFTTPPGYAVRGGSFGASGGGRVGGSGYDDDRRKGIPGLGHDGALLSKSTNPRGGGGGGAGAPGNGSNGGDGRLSYITGSPVYYGGGGAGWGGVGGLGGGGNANTGDYTAAGDGVPNTGGGGAACTHEIILGGAGKGEGGSGIVIVRVMI